MRLWHGYLNDEPVERLRLPVARDGHARRSGWPRGHLFGRRRALRVADRRQPVPRAGNWNSITRPDNVNAEIPVELSDLICGPSRASGMTGPRPAFSLASWANF